MCKYDLHNKITSDGYVYIRIKNVMYGLKQASLLAYDHLKATLAPHGYTPAISTVGLWKHNMRFTNFCLCVDDFGIKYCPKPDAQHFLNVIGRTYSYTTDWYEK